MAGIYVHIPFCHAKCAYCDFFSTPRMESAAAVVGRIIKEYGERLPELGGDAVRTIYFGGGTPSCIAPELLSSVCRALPMDSAKERTIEVNPEDVSPESAGRWLELGFNRVSMGVQSLDDRELARVGRRHNAAEAIAAVATLRRAGFSNISCDLIYGLPGQNVGSWRHSLDSLLDLGIEHLSAYSLSYEPGTRLTALLQAGKIEATDDDTVADMYGILCSRAAETGMIHYEISNFCMPSMHSRHNSSYWDGTPYLGLGPGAHSLSADGVRRASDCNIKLWMKRGAMSEDETPTDRLNDIIITSLRTRRGLDLSQLPPREASSVSSAAESYLSRGWLERHDGRLAIPERHWLVSDAIMRDLML